MTVWLINVKLCAKMFEDYKEATTVPFLPTPIYTVARVVIQKVLTTVNEYSMLWLCSQVCQENWLIFAILSSDENGI